MRTIKKITKKKYNQLLVNASEKGVFYFKEGDTYIGIDNVDGDMYVEEFKTLKACSMWLTDRSWGLEEITKIDKLLHLYELGNAKMFRMYRRAKITIDSLNEDIRAIRERNDFLEKELQRHKELLRKYESIIK